MGSLGRQTLFISGASRGTFLCSQACAPHLERSGNPHILDISPPLNLDPKWFAADGIAVKVLWPRTAIATAAIEFAIGDTSSLRYCRTPEIMADAAHRVLTLPSRATTGQFLIDDEVLAEAGVTDFERYQVEPGAPLALDFFLDDPGPYIKRTVALAAGGHP